MVLLSEEDKINVNIFRIYLTEKSFFHSEYESIDKLNISPESIFYTIYQCYKNNGNLEFFNHLSMLFESNDAFQSINEENYEEVYENIKCEIIPLLDSILESMLNVYFLKNRSCQSILTRGPRKGQNCGHNCTINFCKNHLNTQFLKDEFLKLI